MDSWCLTITPTIPPPVLHDLANPNRPWPIPLLLEVGTIYNVFTLLVSSAERLEKRFKGHTLLTNQPSFRNGEKLEISF
jgi:hypothetical protein